MVGVSGIFSLRSDLRLSFNDLKNNRCFQYVYLNDTLTEKTSTPDNVLSKEFPDNDCDVGAVDFVDQTIDGLLESFPSQSLIGFTVLVCYILLHHPQLGGGDVSSSCLGGQKI